MASEKRSSTVFTLSVSREKRQSGIPARSGSVGRRSCCSRRKDVDTHWGIAAAAAAASFFNLATQINSGFFFVAIMETFHANHTDAAWPGSVFTIMTYLGSCFVVLLQKYFTVSQITLLGSLLLWVPVIGAVFAPNITCMTLALGALHGAGAGIVLVSLMVVLGVHFNKYLGAASGVRDAGTTLCAFAFPSLLSFLHTEYGLRGTLLIYSGLSTHVTVVAFYLWVRARVLEDGKRFTSTAGAIREASVLPPWPPVVKGAHSAPSRKNCENNNNEARRPTGWSHGYRGSWPLSLESFRHEDAGEEPRTILEKFSILTDPRFYVVVVGAVVEIYGYNAFLETIDNYAIDKGAAQSEAEMTVTYATALEIVGYVAVPLIADLNVVRRTTLLTVCFVLLAFFYALSPHAQWEAPYIAADAFLVMFVAATSSLRCSIMTEFFGAAQVPICMAAAGVLLVPVQLMSPSIIGFFRDHLGSYDNMYRLLAASHLLAALLYALLLVHERWIEKKRNEEDGDQCGEVTRM